MDEENRTPSAAQRAIGDLAPKLEGVLLVLAAAGVIGACANANPPLAADPAAARDASLEEGRDASLEEGRDASLEEGRDASPTEVRTVMIRLTMGDRALTATLADNETARDFVSLLPLTLTLRDYNSTEKISDLPRKLSTAGAPEGIDPAVGDITYYAPWGNLALFYRDFGYSGGLIKLGQIGAGVEAFSGSGPLVVTIERVEEP